MKSVECNVWCVQCRVWSVKCSKGVHIVKVADGC